ncbi:hypothetical protein Scep_026319 [Stephania cephalantha]|uniref:Uncharacterized protein n=1 Tax=Stephania cephalantha TaxID=152367 RepID=A0AAP0EMG1_9MAGN
MNEDRRPYPPRAILAQGHTSILLCRAGLLRDKLGSSATSWAPPRPQAKNTPSVSSHQYMPGQHPRNIYWNTNEYK